MALPFFKKSQPDNVIAALDIGSENIQVAVIEIEEKQNTSGELLLRRGNIRGVSKIPLKLGDFNAVTDIASIVDNCQKAIRGASDQAKMTPKHLIMGIAGEFIKGATTTLKHKREDSESKINISELRNIVHKLEWRAFEEVRKAISEETGYSEIDIKLMNAVIVDVRIDGYKVTNPLGFQGKEVQLSIFNSFAPLGHHSALSSIADDLELNLLGIVSEAYAISGLQKSEQNNVSAIYIDVGGSSTDIAVVKNGVLSGTKMFGVGGLTFTKRLSMELNISLIEAEKIKKAYTADKLEPKSKKIISGSIQSDIDIWLEGVTLALSEFKQLDSLPSKILLCGGGTHLPEIKDALNNDKWYQKLHFARRPEARFLEPHEITKLVDETKKLKDQSDIPLMGLGSLGIELYGEESVLQKAVKKVIGIMKV